MNQLLSLVQLQDVTWKTFLLNDITGEITVTSKNSFLTIIESVQNPVTNLVNNPTNSLNMSIYRPLVPLPYSLAIGNFYQVRFNSLYSSIFNLRDLKTKQINTATANSLNFSPLIYSILSIGIVSLFAYVLGTYWVGHKIALIKQ